VDTVAEIQERRGTFLELEKKLFDLQQVCRSSISPILCVSLCSALFKYHVLYTKALDIYKNLLVS